MIASEKITTLPFRTALLRHYIATAFVELMIRVNGEAAYIEDGERIPLNPERVAINIIYHIEAPWLEEFGADDGSRLAAEALEKMLLPGFAGEKLHLSIAGVCELREVYRDIIFGAPDGELPEGMEFSSFHGQGGTL